MRKSFIVSFILLVLLIGVVCADDNSEQTKKINAVIGVWSEQGTKRYDYTMKYVIVTDGNMQVQYNLFDNPDNFQRAWLNYQLKLSKNVTFSPGVIFSSGENFYYGGNVNIDLGKLNIAGMLYAGNKADKFMVFVNYQLTKAIFIQYYTYMQTGYTPDSYIGPKFKIGENGDVWFGTSTNRPGAWAIDASLNCKF